MRKTPTSSTKVSFTSTVTSESGGNVRISLAATETSAIKSGRYVYDVVINSGIDTVSISTVLRVVQGSAIVNAGVTR